MVENTTLFHKRFHHEGGSFVFNLHSITYILRSKWQLCFQYMFYKDTSPRRWQPCFQLHSLFQNIFHKIHHRQGGGFLFNICSIRYITTKLALQGTLMGYKTLPQKYWVGSFVFNICSIRYITTKGAVLFQYVFHKDI